MTIASGWLVNVWSDGAAWPLGILVAGLGCYAVADYRHVRSLAEAHHRTLIMDVCGTRGLIPVDVAVSTWDGLTSVITDGEVPSYVPRTIDGELDARVIDGAGIGGEPVLLIGDPKAGKTRSALEALARNCGSDAVIVRPDGRLDPQRLLDLCRHLVEMHDQVVVFFDDFQNARYRSTTDPGLLEGLAATRNILVVITMHWWGLNEPAASELQLSPTVRRDLIEYLNNLDRVEVASDLDPTEQGEASARFPGLTAAERIALGETMAAAPQLLHRFNNEYTPGADDGRDIVRAAIDLVRLGAGDAVTEDEIRSFLSPRPYVHLRTTGHAPDGVRLSEQGFRWATQPISHVHALLRLVPGTRPPQYRPFEPLAAQEINRRPLTSDLIASVRHDPHLLGNLLQHLVRAETLATAQEQLEALATSDGDRRTVATPLADIALGIIHHRAGHPDRARAAFQAAIDSGHPDHAPTALFNLGVLEAEQGRRPQAEAAYRAAIDTSHPDQGPKAMVNLGLIEHREGRPDEARAAYHAAIETGHPDHAPTAMVNLGSLEAEQGHPAQARAAYLAAIDTRHPDQGPKAMVNLGLIEHREGRPDEARAAFRAAIDTGHPDESPKAMVNLGVLEADHGQPEQARAAFRAAIDTRHPDHGPRAMVDLGALEADHGQPEQARAAFQAAIDTRHPDHGPRAMVNLGLIEYRARRPDEARAAFEAAIESGHPDESPKAMFDLGVLEHKRRRPDQARAAYQSAIATGHPDHSIRAMVNLGDLESGNARPAEARAAYQAAIDAGDPDASPKAMVRLGALEAEQGRPERARDAFRAAIDTGHPDASPGAMVQLGRLEADQGRPEQARAAFDAAWATGHPRSGRDALIEVGVLIARQSLAGGLIDTEGP